MANMIAPAKAKAKFRGFRKKAAVPASPAAKAASRIYSVQSSARAAGGTQARAMSKTKRGGY